MMFKMDLCGFVAITVPATPHRGFEIRCMIPVNRVWNQAACAVVNSGDDCFAKFRTVTRIDTASGSTLNWKILCRRMRAKCVGSIEGGRRMVYGLDTE